MWTKRYTDRPVGVFAERVGLGDSPRANLAADSGILTGIYVKHQGYRRTATRHSLRAKEMGPKHRVSDTRSNSRGHEQFLAGVVHIL